MKEKLTLVMTEEWRESRLDDYIDELIFEWESVGLDLEIDLVEFYTEVPFEEIGGTGQFRPQQSWVEEEIMPLKAVDANTILIMIDPKDGPADNSIGGRVEWLSTSEMWLWATSYERTFYNSIDLSRFTYIVAHEYSHYLRNSRSVFDNTHQVVTRDYFNLHEIMNGLPEYPAYKVEDESTIVLKKDGELYPIATTPELWPVVKSKYNIQDNLPILSREELEGNLGGYAEVDIYFKKI